METTLHGVLLEISGVGVLLLGRSGVGKSESALDLVMRGHRFIADDLIVIRRSETGRLMGRSADMAGSHMEIRGLGIISIEDLFGVVSVLKCREVELVIHLEDSDHHRNTDRLGLDEEQYEILGLRVDYLRIPVTTGRNIAVILEVAARNFLLKQRGCFTAREFDRALTRRLAGEDGKGDGGTEE